jgi:hypothetical protein
MKCKIGIIAACGRDKWFEWLANVEKIRRCAFPFGCNGKRISFSSVM